MSLVDEQWAFVQDVTALLLYCRDHRWVVTFGEAFRTQEQQAIHVSAGRSKTMNSKHLQRLAIDLNFFWDGELCWDREKLKELGDYWEALSPKNAWGGNWQSFKDLPHFERQPEAQPRATTPPHPAAPSLQA